MGKTLDMFWKLTTFQKAKVIVYSFGQGLWRSIGREGRLISKIGTALLEPKIESWKPATPYIPMPSFPTIGLAQRGGAGGVVTEKFEGKIQVGKSGVIEKLFDKDGKDITDQFEPAELKTHKFPGLAGQTVEATVEIKAKPEPKKPEPAKVKADEKPKDATASETTATKTDGAGEKSPAPAPSAPLSMVGAKSLIGAAALRPWKFKDKELDDKILHDPNIVLEEKDNGVLIKVVTGADSMIKEAVSARGEKVDLLKSLPELKDKVLPEQIKDSTFYVEVTHPKGHEFVSGRLHSKPEKAAEVIKQHGPLTFNVIAVHKLAGHDTSKLAYDEMRALRENVAKKLPHGAVPRMAAGSAIEKAKFRDEVFEKNRDVRNQTQDGVVAYDKTAPNKGSVILRDKPLEKFTYQIMGWEPSEKVKNAAASLIYGDGQRKLGKVNLADGGLKAAVPQNWTRYNGKAVLIEGRSQTKSGAIREPVLKQILWDAEAREVVKPFDPDESIKRTVEGMEPDPKQQEQLMYKLKSRAGEKVTA